MVKTDKEIRNIMLYQIRNGTVSFGGKTVLSHIDFVIKGTEKIAVAGRNGAGKSTLLKLIAGELELDRDDKRMGPGITTSRQVTVGMLWQNSLLDRNKTVEEILLEDCPRNELYSRERFAYEMEYDRIFTGFGFDKKEKKKKISSFSGGEQTKIRLIKLLLMKPDILLLDEPTNHLDIPTVEWLESYMKTYDRAVVFVSHDRFFLDQVVDVVYELSGGKMKRYPGNYTAYRNQKQKDIQLQRKAYEKQQAELERLNALIEKFKHKPKKAAFARSRRTVIQRMEKIEPPDEADVHMFTGSIEPMTLGSKWVFEAEHLKIGYEKALLELSLRVRRGQKIGIIGDNGVGKSTFLKTVAGMVPPLEGTCNLGNGIIMGYFDQLSASISSEKSVAEHFHELFPGMTEKEVRHTLGAYLFPGREAAKRVRDLSGGEKSRLVLAELLTGKPNLLILDEPTNHMDIQAKETLESAFTAYTGTILFVSHDRYFISRVADAILVFEGQSVMYYPFGYEHYLEKSRRNPGENPAAMIRTQEQAMIAGLAAVPNKERHETRQMTTEEAYIDWQLRLAAEPVLKAQEEVEILWNRYKHLKKEWKVRSWELWLWEQGLGQTTEKPEINPEYEKLSKELQTAWENWTAKCMEWFEIWEKLE